MHRSTLILFYFFSLSFLKNALTDWGCSLGVRMGQSFAVLDFKQKAVWSRNPVWHLASISPPPSPPHHPRAIAHLVLRALWGRRTHFTHGRKEIWSFCQFSGKKEGKGKEKRKEEREKERLSTWKSTRMSAWSPRKALLVILHHREHMQLHVHLTEAFSFFSQSRLFTMETNGQSKDGVARWAWVRNSWEGK